MGSRHVRLFLALIMSGVAGVAQAQGPYPFHVGVWPQKTSRETVAHKAVAAMAKEKFFFACIDKDGNAWGFDAKTAVVVLSFQFVDDGLHAIVFAAGKEDNEAGRLRNAIRSYVAEAPYDKSAPKQLGKAAVKRSPDVPYLGWHVVNRNETRLLRYYDSVASLVLEKRGLPAQVPGKGLVLACIPEQSVACFAIPGPNAISGNLGVISASGSSDAAQGSARKIGKEIVKLLYD
jgi:hypothetical protein